MTKRSIMETWEGRSSAGAGSSSSSLLQPARMSQKSLLLSMAPYDLHKRLINDYILCRKGATSLLQRDTSRDRSDIDVIRENHKFLWDDNENPDTWEAQLAKKYYDKLYKEYGICDLTYYKENKVAMRWRTEPELVVGRGQFSCGEKHCTKNENLKTWEVNFLYREQGEKKNALIKLRLCPSCSDKLNHHSQKREVKRKKKKLEKMHRKRTSSEKKKKKGKTSESDSSPSEMEETEEESKEESKEDESESKIWGGKEKLDEEKPREEEFEEYLEDLFL